MSKQSKQIIKITLLTIAVCLTILVLTGVCSFESAITTVFITAVIMSTILVILVIAFIIIYSIEQMYKKQSE